MKVDNPGPQNDAAHLITELSRMVSELAQCYEPNRLCELIPYWLERLLQIDCALIAETSEKSDSIALCGIYPISNENCSAVINAFPIQGKLEPFKNLPTGAIYQWPGVEEDLGDFDRALVHSGIQQMMYKIIPTSDDHRWLIAIANFKDGREFSENDRNLFELVAGQSATSLQNAMIYGDLQKNSLKMEAVYQASLALTGSLDLNEVLDSILQHALALMGEATDCHIFLYDETKLTFAAARWADGRTGVPYANPRENGLTYTVARSGQYLAFSNTENHPMFINLQPSFSGAIIGMPLKIGERVVGVISIAFDHPHEFENGEIRILRLLGDLAAVAIEKANLHEIINMQAHTDSLTELANRRSFDERLEYEVLRSSRYNHEFVVIMLDLNGFKQVNDIYGHPAGDHVLKQIAKMLKAHVRDTDLVARYGGDEFVIILPETGMDEAESVLKKLKLLFEQSDLIVSAEITVKLSAEVGYAVFPHDGASVELILATADERLYRAKRLYYGHQKSLFHQ